MSDLLDGLAPGFGIALSPLNLLLCLIGAVVGTATGVLPRVGVFTAVAVLVPVAFGLPPEGAVIMVAAVYFGAQYGGSTAAILLDIPGEASAAATTLDGHQLARQGRAGAALATARMASLVAGLAATIAVVALAPLAVRVSALLRWFGPAEFFSFMILAACLLVALTRGPALKALATVMLGMLVGLVGSDIETGQSRMAFDIPELGDGISFVVAAIGVFGFAEVLCNLAHPAAHDTLDAGLSAIKAAGPLPAVPGSHDRRAAAGAITRGTVLGAILGMLPGGGPVVASFAAHGLERKLSARVGSGAIAGVAAPESANTAAAQTSSALVPLLVFGMSPNAVVALLVVVMTTHGIVPGPAIVSKQPGLFWGLVVAMAVANLMLAVVSLPMTAVWVKLLKVPYRLVFPAIVILSTIGIYSLNNSPFDCIVLVVGGLLGYWLTRHGFEPYPLLFGLMLGAPLEESLRRAILIARGDPSAFVTRPISAILLGIAVVLLAFALWPAAARKRDQVLPEGGDLSPTLAPHRAVAPPAA